MSNFGILTINSNKLLMTPLTTDVGYFVTYINWLTLNSTNTGRVW